MGFIVTTNKQTQKKTVTSETLRDNITRVNTSAVLNEVEMQMVDDRHLMAGSSTTTGLQNDVKMEPNSEIHLAWASSSHTMPLQGQLSAPIFHFPAPIPPQQPLVVQVQQPDRSYG